MSKHVWNNEVQPGCPGVGHGKLYSRAEIELRLEDERKRDSQF
jgi:hypothetical protein